MKLALTDDTHRPHDRVSGSQRRVETEDGSNCGRHLEGMNFNCAFKFNKTLTLSAANSSSSALGRLASNAPATTAVGVGYHVEALDVAPGRERPTPSNFVPQRPSSP